VSARLSQPSNGLASASAPAAPPIDIQAIKDEITEEVMKCIDPLKNETTDAMDTMKALLRKQTMAGMQQATEKRK
jgi:hypothetical protein